MRHTLKYYSYDITHYNITFKTKGKLQCNNDNILLLNLFIYKIDGSLIASYQYNKERYIERYNIDPELGISKEQLTNFVNPLINDIKIQLNLN